MGIGRPTLRSNRVAAYNAGQDKLWVALEKSGIVLPAGSRAESEIEPSADVLRFCGAIELTTAELPLALEVTRRENAICVGSIDQSSGFDWERLISSSAPVPNDAVGLLRAVLRQMSGGMFAARSFGQFDDAIVTSEAFGENEVLNRLESILERAA
ncbi:hypothetical protein [Actinosynnema sp. NPDC023587]|uniref:hypothetical protein n=1 Tax=Actinosynnema sp. NPDC023587 TaxID=3154695 RepID=UPI0033F6CD01